MFSAILWDNDGVLVDTEKYYFQATRETLAEVHVELTEARFRELFLDQSLGAWHLAREKGVPAEDIQKLSDRRNALYLKLLQEGDIAIDGVEETLRKLKPEFKMGIVTSSHKTPFETIHARTGFLRFFSLVLVREDYRNSKPDPESYLRAVERMHLKPGEVLAIEDSKRGMIAAKRAGLTCWVIPNGLTSPDDFPEADRVLTDVREVASLLLV
jgi:HAD superfamily hydrolase (TIGR01509 family)